MTTIQHPERKDFIKKDKETSAIGVAGNARILNGFRLLANILLRKGAVEFKKGAVEFKAKIFRKANTAAC